MRSKYYFFGIEKIRVHLVGSGRVKQECGKAEGIILLQYLYRYAYPYNNIRTVDKMRSIIIFTKGFYTIVLRVLLSCDKKKKP